MRTGGSRLAQGRVGLQGTALYLGHREAQAGTMCSIFQQDCGNREIAGVESHFCDRAGSPKKIRKNLSLEVRSPLLPAVSQTWSFTQTLSTTVQFKGSPFKWSSNHRDDAHVGREHKSSSLGATGLKLCAQFN